MLRYIIQPFYTGYIVLSFLVSLVLAFPFFLITGWINTSASGKISYRLVHYWSRCWLYLIGMPVKITGSFPKEKKFVIIANHISYLDTLNIYAVVPEYFKTLARREMAAIPVFGMIYRQLTILVDRSSHESRTKSLRLMWKQLKEETHIALFPEGSFNETGAVLKDFYDGAFRLAVNTQTPILPIIFPDTEKRWHYSAWWKLTPGKNRAFILPPIDVVGKDISAIKEEAFLRMKESLLQQR